MKRSLAALFLAFTMASPGVGQGLFDNLSLDGTLDLVGFDGTTLVRFHLNNNTLQRWPASTINRDLTWCEPFGPLTDHICKTEIYDEGGLFTFGSKVDKALGVGTFGGENVPHLTRLAAMGPPPDLVTGDNILTGHLFEATQWYNRPGADLPTARATIVTRDAVLVPAHVTETGLPPCGLGVHQNEGGLLYDPLTEKHLRCLPSQGWVSF